MRKAFSLLILIAVIAAAAVPAMAQEDKTAAKTPLRKEIVRLKYLNAGDVAQAVRLYLDPRLGEMLGGDHSILTVTATPETMGRILKAIGELDVKPADILITVQLLLGEEIEGKTDPELQADPIVKELRRLLRYKTYTLLDTSLLRAVDKGRSEIVLGPKAEFAFSVEPNVVREDKGEVVRLEVQLAQKNQGTLIKSSLNIRSGDKTVVGVSKLDGGDKGLILIITGKVV